MKLSDKQIKTQEHMKETRYNDFINLREKIKNKISWIENEINKGQQVVEQKKREVENINIQIIKLDGAKIALLDILKNDSQGQ